MIEDAVAVMALLGFLTGVALAGASRLFYVKEDPRIEAVTAVLPGLNCGACGFAGCAGAARAIVSGKARVNACCVGGFTVTQKIAVMLQKNEICEGPVTAVAGCRGGKRTEWKYHYAGVHHCRAEYLFFGGSSGCERACLGYASCAAVCPVDAIRLDTDHCPVVDEARCMGCGRCVDVCPSGVLSLMSAAEKLLHFNRTDECLAPCRQKCPAQVDVPGMIGHIRNKNYAGALLKIKERNPLVLSAGRVCGHPCENICRRNIADEGVAICVLERFAGDWEIRSGKRVPVRCNPDTGHRVAVVGGGPAGLSCAYFLRRLGHQPTIFEKRADLGGMLRYGIPEYRLPKKLVDWDIRGIIELGVKVKTNTALGVDFSLDDLKADGYTAVFLGLGAWTVPALCVDGEYCSGVINSLNFLSGARTVITDLSGTLVTVIGESNTAMDCARTAVRLGARRVTVLSPVDQKEMTARKNDVTRAMEEGVDIRFLTVPTRIIPTDSGWVSGIGYCRVEPSKGNRGVIGARITGSGDQMDTSLVISAYDRKPDVEYFLSGLSGDFCFTASEKATLYADPVTLLAAVPDIFIAGDLYTGRSSVIEAVAGGRRAARSIHSHLSQDPAGGVVRGNRFFSENEQKKINPRSIIKHVRVSDQTPKLTVYELPAAVRKASFVEEIQKTIFEKQAVIEARRCLQCGTVCND